MPNEHFDADFLGLQQALAGEYSLERELGRGGMGIVYLAREVSLDRPVAIKVLPPALAVRPDVRERFLREARTAAQLSHPNVVAIHRADERAGFAFFVMAFVDGETLGERIRRLGPLPPPLAAKILREVGWALGYAHARGIVHRDIKPDNILLERDTGRALVTDFGIAQLGDPSASLTGVGLVLGSAHFMSPEQAAGERVDGRSDLYSLGVVGYFALTGRLPFDGDSVQAILAKQITQPAPDLDIHGVPPALSGAIQRLLAKSLDSRFASGEELSDALAGAERDAAPIPAPVRLWINRGMEQRTTTLVLDALVLLFTTLQIAMRLASQGRLSLFGSYLALLLLPPVLQALQMVASTHRALQAGFDLGDLSQGLRRTASMRLEERQMDAALSRSPVGRWLARFAWGAFGVGVLLDLIAAYGDNRLLLVELAGASIATAFVSGIASAAFPRSSATPSGLAGLADRLRIRFWEGWGGRAIARLARIGVRPHVAAASHRQTETILALAIGDLFRALPLHLRREWPHLLELVSRLEHEARRVRLHLTSDDTAPSRLADIGVALETIRLGLLRLLAGEQESVALTGPIRNALEFARDVDRVVQARAEVDAVLADTPT